MGSARIMFLCVVAISALAGPVRATELSPDRPRDRQWPAGQLFQQAASRGLMLGPEGISLANHILIEDDAPACGFSTVDGADEILKQGVVLQKTLIVDRWPVKGAVITMLVYPLKPAEPNNGRHLLFNVNGHPEIVYEVNHFWTSAPVPVEYLKQGKNVIEVRVQEPDTEFKTFVALEQNYATGSTERLHHPNRSARSADGGKTWSDTQLGAKGLVDGEYSIRLNLEAYEPEGWLESPVIDPGEGPEAVVVRLPVQALAAALKLDAVRPEQTGIKLLARTGKHHTAQAEGWSDWTALEDGKLPVSLLGQRYLQYRLVFSSESGEKTPLLKGVALEASCRAADPQARAGLRVLSAANHPCVQSSLPFQHENPRNEKLQQLRRQYKLDEVVAGARTEFEKLLKLKTWVARQWNWYLPGPDYGDMCEWDACKILQPGKDGKNGGYCLHYAIVFAQACQSFGIPARVINANYSIWGGHEMTEVWSNDYGKWVLMDANFDTCFFDRSTGQPLNALELHRVFTQTWYKGEVIDRDHWPRTDMVARAERVGLNLPLDAIIGGGARGATLTNYAWWKPVVELSDYCGGYGPINLAELRYLPRSNFLSQPRPMPVNHGRSHWGWTGYYCWYDEQTPRTPEHAIHTTRAADLYPVLNSVDFAAEAVAPGRLHLDLATDSPDFDHYQLLVNGREIRVTREEHIQSAAPHVADYEWQLAPGHNRIELRVVDGMGNRGPVSHLELTWLPPATEAGQTAAGK